MAVLGLAPGLRTVFDAPRTAALYRSCLLRTEGSGLGSPKEPPVLGVKARDVLEVDVRCRRDVKKVKQEKSISSSNGMVKFLVGCTDSEEEDFNEEIKNNAKVQMALGESACSVKALGLRRCSATQDGGRKRMQSECSSGVSTHFSCSDTNNSSNCSILSGLSSEDDVDDVSDPASSGVSSMQSDKGFISALDASMEAMPLVSATNEGVDVAVSPPLTECLVVNPAPSVEIVWSYAVVGETMVAKAPSSIQKVCGINDALVTLLEYGENDLCCSRAVILIERNSPEKDSLQRMFSFLGFTPINVNATPQSLRPYCKQHILMVTDFSDLQENDSDFDSEL